MPRTDLPADRTHPAGAAPTASTRRTAAGRRRRMRLRRTAVLALVVLLVATVTARWFEDPHDITVASAHVAAAEASSGSPHSENARPTRSSTSPTESSAPPSPSTTPAITSAPAAPVKPTTSAAPHADEESDGSATPAPNASKVTGSTTGAGTISAQPIPADEIEGSGRTVHYSIEVEDGLLVSGPEFAVAVHTVLNDPRGWQTEDGVRFVPVSPAEVAAGARMDIRVTLASPALTARLCAPLNITQQQVSCWNGSRAVLNVTRWLLGSATYGTDLAHYRIYLINHEVGHGLGHGHAHCPGPGKPAPVMVQQTKSLEGCVPSPWPTGT